MLNKLKEKMDAISRKAEEVGKEILSDKVSEEIRTERYNTCLSCEKLYYPTKTCKVCGCFMNIKTWMPNQKCPLNKWGPVESKTSNQ